MKSASYEVCLLTSPVREALPKLREMLAPLDRLHNKTLDCVELHYSGDRDALLLRLSFSEIFSTRLSQKDTVQRLAGKGFDILESSELSAQEYPRFEKLLLEQYSFRLQQYPSAHVPVKERILGALESHLEPLAAANSGAPMHLPTSSSRPARRLSTIDAFELIISEIPMFEGDAEGSSDGIDLLTGARAENRARTFPVKAVADEMPLRMETFGPLDDMIARLPRPKTQESIDEVLDSLWPS